MQKNSTTRRLPSGRQVMCGLTVLAGLISQAYAQEAAPAAAQAPAPAPAPAAAAANATPASAATPAAATPAAADAPAATPGDDSAVQTVKVTGYVGSLETSARDKRNSVGFQDSVFSEDLGKFPDTNIAESLNRIPGVQITREISGEGLNIQIRGLGTSFTKVTLNGASVAVASTGRTDSQNTNREVDLDMLPTDLFRKLTVNKSPTADMLEGGAAGVVDMRSARPFDDPGQHVAINLTGMENNVAKKPGDRGSFLASQTFDNGFGILGGFSWADAKVRTTGFESVGWTNPNLSAAQDSDPNRNSTGGGNYNIPAVVPAGAGNGLIPGTVIDQAFLLAHNPGLTIQQIDNAIIPRLGRTMDEWGSKDKYTGIVALEYRPSEALHFYLDTLYSKKNNDLQRADMDWVGRNGAMIPLNMTVDRTDCANGCTVTGGTFANSQYFLEYRPYTENTTLWGLNPGVEWQLAKNLKLDAQANLTKSTFLRDSPTVLPITALGSGLTTTYTNGAVPTMSSSVDLDNPANFGWSGGRVNLQEEIRNTETKGFHSNLTWGDKALNVKAGVAYDDISRTIRAKDNSGAWQAAVCGDNPSVFLPSPNGSPACDGSTGVGSATGLYPGYGTGYTAGATGTPTYQGSLIPAAALASYLHAGPDGYITVDWSKFKQNTNYASFVASAPDVGSSNTSASAGYIRERTRGFFTELNGESTVADYLLRYNAGVRYVHTDQTVGGFISLPDPRNASETLSGSEYPNLNSVYYLSTQYDDVLPSASVAMNLTKDVIARASVSRSMTRADPNALRPGINFSSPSADVGTIGNSSLKPYISDNIDLGLEWYTGREGYVSATYFDKRINGFTVNENVTTPFSALAAYGVTYSALTPTQQQAIDARGGPDTATVVLTEPSNASGILHIQGLELGWVQPLDKWLPIKGFGFSDNVTMTHQKASGQGSAGFIALGVPKVTNNAVAYYQRDGYSIRLSHSYAQGSQVATANQNGITNAALFADSYQQLDLSSSVDLEEVMDRKGWPTLTFDVVNLSNSTQRTYFQFEDATYTLYKPGPTFSIGLRAKF